MRGQGTDSAGFGVVGSEFFNCRLTALLEQDFDLLFRLLERGLTRTSQHHAALESGQGFLERQIALFEALHQLFEVAHGRLKIGWCIGCVFARWHDRERYTRTPAGTNSSVRATASVN